MLDEKIVDKEAREYSNMMEEYWYMFKKLPRYSKEEFSDIYFYNSNKNKEYNKLERLDLINCCYEEVLQIYNGIKN